MTASILDSPDFAPNLVGIALVVLLVLWALGKMRTVYNETRGRYVDPSIEPIASHKRSWREEVK
jgi:hypothetical protein